MKEKMKAIEQAHGKNKTQGSDPSADISVEHGYYDLNMAKVFL